MSKAPKITKNNIVFDDNPALRQKSVDVTFPLSKEDEETLESMIEYLEYSQDPELAKEFDLQPGVGLAAPQIGVYKNMFAVLTEDEKGKLHKYALVNPKLVSNSVAKCFLTGGEGCLSVKEAHAGYVKRYYKIKMKAYDYVSKSDVVLSLKGYVAIVLQHEYDHLFGVLFYDRINKQNPMDNSDNDIPIE